VTLGVSVELNVGFCVTVSVLLEVALGPAV
jgi:hypothetical protein